MTPVNWWKKSGQVGIKSQNSSLFSVGVHRAHSTTRESLEDENPTKCCSSAVRLISHAWIHSRLYFWSRTVSSWKDCGFFWFMVWMQRFLLTLPGRYRGAGLVSGCRQQGGLSPEPGYAVGAYTPLQFLSGEGQLCLHASSQVCHRRSSGTPLPGSHIPKALSGELGTDAILDVQREQHWNKYTIKGETDHQPRLDAWDQCSGLVHWEDPEGWDGEGGGRGEQDVEHM